MTLSTTTPPLFRTKKRPTPHTKRRRASSSSTRSTDNSRNSAPSTPFYHQLALSFCFRHPSITHWIFNYASVSCTGMSILHPIIFYFLLIYCVHVYVFVLFCVLNFYISGFLLTCPCFIAFEMLFFFFCSKSVFFFVV